MDGLGLGSRDLEIGSPTRRVMGVGFDWGFQGFSICAFDFCSLANHMMKNELVVRL